MKVDLEDKIALVTGAAQGIGQAIAERFVKSGATGVFSDRNMAGVEESALNAGSKHFKKLDVTDDNEIEVRIKEIIEELGRIDILVNNAGGGVSAGERKIVSEFDPQTWDRLIQLDLRGVFMVSREVANYMVSRKSGRIINIASVLGLVPMRLQSPYVAAKSAGVNLTRSMALELAQHEILVNAVAPGSTATEDWYRWMQNQASEDQGLYQRLMSHIPLGRPGTPEEMAHAVLFLADPDSKYITGHVLTVDGGWTAGFARDF